MKIIIISKYNLLNCSTVSQAPQKRNIRCKLLVQIKCLVYSSCLRDLGESGCGSAAKTAAVLTYRRAQRLNVTKRVWFPALGHAFSRAFHMNLPAPFYLQREGKYLQRGAGATEGHAGCRRSSRRDGSRTWRRWERRSLSERKEEVAGTAAIPVLPSAGQHAEPSPARR